MQTVSTILNFSEEATAVTEVMTMMMTRVTELTVLGSSVPHSRGIGAICLHVINIQN